MSIRIASETDLALYQEHLNRHRAESGRNGNMVFTPVEKDFEQPLAELREHTLPRWRKRVGESGWERVWIAEQEGMVIGSLVLVHRPPLETNRHRATLMMGLEASARGQGIGTQMVSHALEWARQQPILEWIDLFVFAHNEPARKLYGKFGFREIGRTEDMFRVFGQSITDIAMTLRLIEP